ncbi:serine/threonine protein kinase [Phototrophicus methaneseepsis]|uniref:non-specific serine/threonine protein kinase n=1 Tax=Phototrophicus methaneseepsis TaxID=2710758 RepID=A0A7S8EAS8_9CHLR|nr:serine/threonine-protein kinase [Phototrophicus methaneseepsis]QPC83526.1 serine/threonine protein kinase [Phototrophicus methaneseepsis]
MTDDLIGKILGDYRLERKLTSGGMSHVYIGIDEKLGRRAAVKILTPEFQDQDKSLKVRFSREAKAVAQLEHDNIITIYQYGEVDGMYFLAMRYIDGPDLSDVIKTYRTKGELMPVERALAILEQVAIALDYAHARGIIHRDVKPSNVLLGHDDKAVLTDFGLVLWADVDNTLGTAFGTPRYISPEQATDSQLAVPQSDIYSLGVMAYEIFTGKHLFTGQNAMEVALAHIHEPPMPPRAHNPRMPGDAQAQILKALEKEPEQRHSTAVEFIHALKSAYNVAHDEYGPTLPFRPDTHSTPIVGSAAAAVGSASSDKFNTPSFNKITSPLTESPTATPSEKARATTKILQSWDEPAPAPDIAEKMRGNRSLPIIGGMGVVLLAVIIFAVMMMGGGNGDEGTPTAVMDTNDQVVAAEGTLISPTATPTPIPTVAPQEAIFRLRYNDDLIVLVNEGPSTLFMTGLGIRGTDDDDSYQSSGLEALQPGQCLVVKNNLQSATVPTAWRCSTMQEVTVSSSHSRFWYADTASDDLFRVLNEGREVGSCETVGRLVGRQTTECVIQWPNFDTERKGV